MFTGIIKKTGKVESARLTRGGMILGVRNALEEVKEGGSIAINGVCSTVKKAGKTLGFEYIPETLKLTNLTALKKGDKVNLEQSMRLGDRLDGHIVLGHVDSRGKIVSIKKERNSLVFEIKIPNEKFRKFLVYKGSIAVEGISLTVAKVLIHSFIVKIIPYTLKHTNLKFKKIGDIVNLEFDILAKYAHSSRTKFSITGRRDKDY